MKERIQLGQTLVQSMTLMAEGNPGAIKALLEVMNKTDKIDPDSALGGYGPMLQLDSYGIYGSEIYILYSDICNRNLPQMIAVLRAVQLGFFKREVLKDAVSRQDRTGKDLVPVEDLYLKVIEALPEFNKINRETNDKQIQ